MTRTLASNQTNLSHDTSITKSHIKKIRIYLHNTMRALIHAQYNNIKNNRKITTFVLCRKTTILTQIPLYCVGKHIYTLQKCTVSETHLTLNRLYCVGKHINTIKKLYCVGKHINTKSLVLCRKHIDTNSLVLCRKNTFNTKSLVLCRKNT